MYICEECGRVSRPGEKCHIVTVETRQHTFPFRIKANTFKRYGKIEHRDDQGGVGTQIVCEARLCGSCAGVRQ